ncbi:hypothetical protein [Salinicoccus roseus]|uniref:Uncharacterized protein n=1 Tax=Salinicoccus roseus TaxID=45670 RepID=A0A265E850_9STAP|nr:hypothetical protein [Salinicoccus roseus]OZT77782.1 hypothetical protein CFN03_00385 [Salinicoccus roseus]
MKKILVGATLLVTMAVVNKKVASNRTINQTKSLPSVEIEFNTKPLQKFIADLQRELNSIK